MKKKTNRPCIRCKIDFPINEMIVAYHHKHSGEMYKCESCYNIGNKKAGLKKGYEKQDESIANNYIKFLEDGVKDVDDPRGYNNSMAGEHRCIL